MIHSFIISFTSHSLKIRRFCGAKVTNYVTKRRHFKTLFFRVYEKKILNEIYLKNVTSEMADYFSK